MAEQRELPSRDASTVHTIAFWTRSFVQSSSLPSCLAGPCLTNHTCLHSQSLAIIFNPENFQRYLLHERQ